MDEDGVVLNSYEKYMIPHRAINFIGGGDG